MKQFPANIKFKYEWRVYQKRVLDELEAHLEDNHLHIIAPPGSGKTVLGLEVARRLDKPTLILAPTVAIRNQWVQRFCELFLQVKHKPDWISRDIKNPKFLTITTYQALHAACSATTLDDEKTALEEVHFSTKNSHSNSSTKNLIALLQAQDIRTIVVDEAHHLKNAWWHSLTEVKKALNPTIVGLTATPPYDVSHLEWQRYTTMNGPVDAEISVPELVVEGDLCPHQDYIFFSRPTIDESLKIKEHRQRLQTLVNEIKADQVLIEALENHPIYQTPDEQLEWIYTNLVYYSATLIFLNAVGKEVTKSHLDIIGNKKFKTPQLNLEWLEVLLTFYLYKDPENFASYEAHQERLTKKLKRSGAMERRSVNLRYNRRVSSFLSSSLSKLKSIGQIVDFEQERLKQNLRMVILTDYIRKEFLLNQPKNDLELNKIGVLPIFEQLRRTNKQNIKIGVLTGSVIIIPTSAFLSFKEVASKYKIEDIPTSPLPFDDQYVVINTTEQLRHDIVHIITQVFQKGHIEVLVGTKSLLGEGWDAPAINALILASFVGSYVLSNQMRGRAIRTEQRNIDKTANIWHLVCVDPTSQDGGDDIQVLKRRFKAFVGVSFRGESSIENGIARIGLPNQIRTEQQITNLNNRMLTSAGQRGQLKEKWHQALAHGTTLIEEIKVPFPEGRDYKGEKSFYYYRTISYMFASLGSMLLFLGESILESFLRSIHQFESPEAFFRWLMFVGIVSFLFCGTQLFKTVRLYIKHRDISKDIHQIGEAVLESLIKVGVIHTDYSKLTVISSIDKFGSIYCHLDGATAYEKSMFIKSLQEIVGPVNNPRYVIIRKGFLLNILSQKDYHAVPEIIGRKKQFAEYFERQWKRFVGTCELVYTRTNKGRKLLLKSRIHSLAAAFEERTERINKWR